MGKYTDIEGPYKCEECEATLASKFSQESESWDWFHQYLPRTVHFCPEHKNSALRKELWNKGQVKPEPQTKKEVWIP